VPIDGSLVPRAKTTFEEFVFVRRGEIVPVDNPRHNTIAHSDDKRLIAAGFFEAIDTNTAVLDTFIDNFMVDKDIWVFSEMFPVVIDKRVEHHWDTFQIEPMMPTTATLGVPGRNITFKRQARKQSSMYTGSGFAMSRDLILADPQAALRELSLKVMRFTGDAWASMIYSTLMQLHITPSAYGSPDQKFPYSALPRTLDQLFDTIHPMFGMYNKTPDASQQLAGMAARVFECQEGVTLKGVIASRTDVLYAAQGDAARIFFDKSGAQAELARSTDGTGDALTDGVRVFSVPFLGNTVHGGRERDLLEQRVRIGSHYAFQDRTLQDPRGEFNASHRRIVVHDSVTDDLVPVDFGEFLRHCVEFNKDWAGGGDDKPGDPFYVMRRRNGKVNRDFNAHQAAHARDELSADNPYVLTQTIREKNLTTLNTTIRYIGDALSPEQRAAGTAFNVSVELVGEIDPVHCRSDYLRSGVMKTLWHALEELTPDERVALQAGLDLAERLSSQNPIAEIIDAVVEVSGKDTFETGYGDHVRVSRPNRFGFVDLSRSKNFVGICAKNPDCFFGFGTISGLLTMHDLFQTEPTVRAAHPHTAQTLDKFVPAYVKAVQTMSEVSIVDDHVGLAPSMAPMEIRYPDTVDDATRTLIVAWYTMFSTYYEPAVVVRNGPGSADTQKLISALSSSDVKNLERIFEKDGQLGNPEFVSGVSVANAILNNIGLAGNLGDIAELYKAGSKSFRKDLLSVVLKLDAKDGKIGKMLGEVLSLPLYVVQALASMDITSAPTLKEVIANTYAIPVDFKRANGTVVQIGYHQGRKGYSGPASSSSPGGPGGPGGGKGRSKGTSRGFLGALGGFLSTFIPTSESTSTDAATVTTKIEEITAAFEADQELYTKTKSRITDTVIAVLQADEPLVGAFPNSFKGVCEAALTVYVSMTVARQSIENLMALEARIHDLKTQAANLELEGEVKRAAGVGDRIITLKTGIQEWMRLFKLKQNESLVKDNIKRLVARYRLPLYKNYDVKRLGLLNESEGVRDSDGMMKWLAASVMVRLYNTMSFTADGRESDIERYNDAVLTVNASSGIFLRKSVLSAILSFTTSGDPSMAVLLVIAKGATDEIARDMSPAVFVANYSVEPSGASPAAAAAADAADDAKDAAADAIAARDDAESLAEDAEDDESYAESASDVDEARDYADDAEEDAEDADEDAKAAEEAAARAEEAAARAREAAERSASDGEPGASGASISATVAGAAAVVAGAASGAASAFASAAGAAAASTFDLLAGSAEASPSTSTSGAGAAEGGGSRPSFPGAALLKRASEVEPEKYYDIAEKAAVLGLSSGKIAGIEKRFYDFLQFGLIGDDMHKFVARSNSKNPDKPRASIIPALYFTGGLRIAFMYISRLRAQMSKAARESGGESSEAYEQAALRFRAACEAFIYAMGQHIAKKHYSGDGTDSFLVKLFTFQNDDKSNDGVWRPATDTSNIPAWVTAGAVPVTIRGDAKDSEKLWWSFVRSGMYIHLIFALIVRGGIKVTDIMDVRDALFVSSFNKIPKTFRDSNEAAVKLYFNSLRNDAEPSGPYPRQYAGYYEQITRDATEFKNYLTDKVKNRLGFTDIDSADFDLAPEELPTDLDFSDDADARKFLKENHTGDHLVRISATASETFSLDGMSAFFDNASARYAKLAGALEPAKSPLLRVNHAAAVWIEATESTLSGYAAMRLSEQPRIAQKYAEILRDASSAVNVSLKAALDDTAMDRRALRLKTFNKAHANTELAAAATQAEADYATVSAAVKAYAALDESQRAATVLDTAQIDAVCVFVKALVRKYAKEVEDKNYSGAKEEKTLRDRLQMCQNTLADFQQLATALRLHNEIAMIYAKVPMVVEAALAVASSGDGGATLALLEETVVGAKLSRPTPATNTGVDDALEKLRAGKTVDYNRLLKDLRTAPKAAPGTAGQLRTLLLRSTFGATGEWAGYEGYWTESVAPSFAETDRTGLGGTLLTALGYVNPRLPLMARSAQNASLGRYRNGEAHDWLATWLYNENKFGDLLRETYGVYPCGAIHASLFALAGNPQSSEVPWIERRFKKTSSMVLLEALATRLGLLTALSVPQMQKWLTRRINVPLGGMFFRNSQEYTGNGQFWIGTGPQGEKMGEMRFSGFDQMVSKDSLTGRLSFQGSFHSCAILKDDRLFFYQPNTRISTYHGGDGPRWIDEMENGTLVPLWRDDPRLMASAALREMSEYIRNNRFYSGAEQGSFSNVAVLQGYNVAVEHNLPRHIDISGNWNPASFAGQIVLAPEFVAVRDKEMYPGQYTITQVFPIERQQPAFNLNTLNVSQQALINSRNNIVHQDSCWVYDPLIKQDEVKSFHPLGDKYRGCAARNTSRVQIPESATALITY
jgi:hypothetical protein